MGTLEALLEPGNKDRLVDLLRYHVVVGALGRQDLALKTVEAVNGKSIDVFDRQGVLSLNASKITGKEIVGSNGIVHAIDAVLLPPDVRADVSPHWKNGKLTMTIGWAKSGGVTLFSKEELKEGHFEITFYETLLTKAHWRDEWRTPLTRSDLKLLQGDSEAVTVTEGGKQKLATEDQQHKGRLAEELARSLIPEAASISNADFQKLQTNPSPQTIENKSLSLILMSLDTRDQSPEAAGDFRFLVEGFPQPSEIAAAMSPRRSKGYFSIIQPDYITECKITSSTDETAQGKVTFNAPRLYVGSVTFEARKHEGKWRIKKFRLPSRRITVELGEDGDWRRKPTDQSGDEQQRSTDMDNFDLPKRKSTLTPRRHDHSRKPRRWSSSISATDGSPRKVKACCLCRQRSRPWTPRRS